MRTFFLSGTILLAATASTLAADPVGEWLVKDGSARIKVVSCTGTLWGVISAETKPGRDTENPDPSMKNRPMLGVPILIGMKPTEANLWNGKIYDARGGSLYDAKISLSKSDKLEVRGCMASIFCGGEDWTRITNPNTPPLPPAASATPSAPAAKGGAMAPQGSAMAPKAATTGGAPKGNAMAKAGPAGAAAGDDPICSTVSSLVPRE